MQALKVVAEGQVTSFRYPHFVQGTQLTFEMPPPATIYGHVCSAVGYELDPASLQFAYHFTWESKFMDYEHLHFFGNDPKLNPFNRELLFRPQLTLYLSEPALLPYFMSPRYTVVLGRSQDLMTYTSVRLVDLVKADEAFLGDTLLPLDLAARLEGHSYAVTMPRFIGSDRVSRWQQYAVLRGSVQVHGNAGESWSIEGDEADLLWVDPDDDARSPDGRRQRAVVWHRWV